jgi:hypothetical protein
MGAVCGTGVAPAVRLGDAAGVEQVGRPATVRERAIVGSGFEQDDVGVGVPGDDAGQGRAGGATAADEDIDPLCTRHGVTTNV